MGSKKGKKKKKKAKKKETNIGNRGFFTILWDNVQGEYKESIESGEFKGVVKAMALSRGKVLLVGLVSSLFGPAAPYAAPLVEFVLTKTVNVVWETVKESFQGYGTFEIQTTKSGLAVLKNPKLVTLQNKVLEMPKRIEIPSKTLVAPDEDLIFKPTFQRSVRRRTGLLGSRLASSRRSLRSRPSLLEGLNQKSPDPDRLPTLLRAQPKSGTSLTDVLYPEWVHTGKPSASSILGRRSRRSVSFSEWYQKDQQRARKSLAEYAAASSSRKFHQGSAARALKTHQDSVKRSQESAQRARKAHEDFVKRTRRNNPHNKPPWRR